MHFLSQSLLLAQFSEEAISREMARLQRNYEFLSYGLIAAWLILVVYVLMMVARQRRLKREIAGLRAMLEDKQR
jgi:CcmD family protein